MLIVAARVLTLDVYHLVVRYVGKNGEKKVFRGIWFRCEQEKERLDAMWRAPMSRLSR